MRSEMKSEDVMIKEIGKYLETIAEEAMEEHFVSDRIEVLKIEIEGTPVYLGEKNLGYGGKGTIRYYSRLQEVRLQVTAAPNWKAYYISCKIKDFKDARFF